MLDKEEVLQIIKNITWGDDLVGDWHISPDNLLEEIEKLPVYEDTELLKEALRLLEVPVEVEAMEYHRRKIDKAILRDKLKERLDIK